MPGASHPASPSWCVQRHHLRPDNISSNLTLSLTFTFPTNISSTLTLCFIFTIRDNRHHPTTTNSSLSIISNVHSVMLSRDPLPCQVVFQYECEWLKLLCGDLGCVRTLQRSDTYLVRFASTQLAHVSAGTGRGQERGVRTMIVRDASL
jgi:hypothetical protein